MSYLNFRTALKHSCAGCANPAPDESCCFPSRRLDFANQGLRFLLFRAIGKDNVSAPPRKIDCCIAAQPAAATRDNCDPIRHASSSFLFHRDLSWIDWTQSTVFLLESEIPCRRLSEW